jgi:hypothetical protein
MGCFGGGSVPPPPGLSTEELNLLHKQGLTLDQLHEFLSEESIQKKETQELLKGLSGLYKTVEIPGTDPRKDYAVGDTTKLAEAVSKVATLKSETPRAILRAAGVSEEVINRLAASETGGASLGQFNAEFSRIVEEAKKDPGGAGVKYGLSTLTDIPGTDPTTKQELDPEAVANLRSRIQANIAAEQSIRDEANKFLQGFLNRPKSEYEQLQEEAGILSARRLVAALKGELPVSKQSQDRKMRDFALLKEMAGRQGTTIEGDDPCSASADSTAGAAMLREFNSRWDYAEELERRGEIDSGTAQNLARHGLVSDLEGRKFGQAVTLKSGGGGTDVPINLATMALNAGSPNLSGYGSLLQGYSLMQQPYQNYNNLLYQGMLQGYNNSHAGDVALGQLLGYGGTALLTRGLLR